MKTSQKHEVTCCLCGNKWYVQKLNHIMHYFCSDKCWKLAPENMNNLICEHNKYKSKIN